MNRIAELLRERGMRQATLAEKTGIDPGHLSRMIRSERGIGMKQAIAIAKALNVTPSEVLGLPEPDNAAVQDMPLTDEWAPYRAEAGDPFYPFTGPNRYWVTINSDAVKRAGPARGDLALVDVSASAVASKKPLAIVTVSYFPNGQRERSVKLIRQFVPPSLLITNGIRQPNLDTDIDPVEIIGIVLQFHRALTN